MQDLERLAAFTMIESIKHQLEGLERLLAGAAALGKGGQQRGSVRVEPQVQESPYATEEEEARIAEMMETQRQQELATLSARAAATHSGIWQQTAGDMTAPRG